jgi:hypothetical protein
MLLRMASIKGIAMVLSSSPHQFPMVRKAGTVRRRTEIKIEIEIKAEIETLNPDRARPSGVPMSVTKIFSRTAILSYMT